MSLKVRANCELYFVICRFGVLGRDYQILRHKGGGNGFIRVYRVVLSGNEAVPGDRAPWKGDRLKLTLTAETLLYSRLSSGWCKCWVISWRSRHPSHNEGTLGNVREQWHRCTAQGCWLFFLSLFIGLSSHHHVPGLELCYVLAILTLLGYYCAVCVHTL